MSLPRYLTLGVSALALSLPVSAAAQASEQGGSAPSNPSAQQGSGARGPSQQSASVDPNDIIVTATRRDASILDAPLSISAYSQESLDIKGVRNIEDLARMTPGVSLNQGAFGTKYLVIRGLSSTIGATMNGVYVDDTPVQVRSVSTTGNFYPAMFDLERVEVLRGPQGTLFGAGSMGGAIRFISAKPSVTDYSGYARGELGFTEGGDPSYEAGIAFGGPIVDNKIGFRVSGNYRRDGGYIDRVPYVASRGTARKNHNERDTYVGQFSLMLQPVDGITITPSIFHQQANRDNSDQFWEWRPGVDLPTLPKFFSGEGIDSYGRDRATIYSVRGEFDLGPATIITNTAYLDRRVVNKDDATAYYLDAFGLPVGLDIPGVLDPRIIINMEMTQRAFTQELRVQSNPSSSPISYVAGIFYQNSRQTAEEFDVAPNPDQFIVPSTNGNVGYLLDNARDQQFAVFGQVDYKLADKLTVSAGVRYSYVTFDFKQTGGNNLPTDTVLTGSTDESPITPKFGIEYKPTDNLMFYASAGKGFRPGGSNAILSSQLDDSCLAQLQNLGYSQIPAQYRSDSTWSYEVGAKGRVGNWLTFAGDVFQIDWTDVQRSRSVLNCGVPFIDNLGKSRARGVEAKITLTPVTGLTLDANVSYTDAKVRQTLIRPEFVNDDGSVIPAGNIVTKGDRFAPPWIVSLSADYETDLGVGDVVGFGRVQWDYRSGLTNPSGNLGYNPLYARVPARDFVAARLGARTGQTDVSLFVNNLLNSRDELGRLVIGAGQRQLRQTYRPRTWGVTVSQRF